MCDGNKKGRPGNLEREMRAIKDLCPMKPAKDFHNSRVQQRKECYMPQQKLQLLCCFSFINNMKIPILINNGNI